MLSRFIPSDGFGKKVLALAGGTIVAQLITAGAIPIVTRIYTPVEIGVVSLFMSFFGFWSQLLSWRYEYAMFIANDDNELRSIFDLGVYIAFLMSLLAVPVIYASIRSDLFGFGLLPWWSPIAAAFILFGYGIFMLYRLWALRGGFVQLINQATISRAASNALARIALGLVGGKVLGLFIAEAAGAWGGVAPLRRMIGQQYSFRKVERSSWRTKYEVAKRYIKFPKYDMVSTAIDQLTLALPLPIVASLYGAKEAGWFGMARLIIALPNAQVGRAVSDIFQSQLSQKMREGDYAAARSLFLLLLRKLSLFGLIPLLVVMALAPLCTPWILGKPWAETGILMACIAPWMYASLVVNSLSGLVSVLERQEYKLIYDVAALVLIALVYFASRYWTLSLVASVMLMAAANVMSYAIYLAIYIVIVSRHLTKRD